MFKQLHESRVADCTRSITAVHYEAAELLAQPRAASRDEPRAPAGPGRRISGRPGARTEFGPAGRSWRAREGPAPTVSGVVLALESAASVIDDCLDRWCGPTNGSSSWTEATVDSHGTARGSVLALRFTTADSRASPSSGTQRSTGVQ